MGMQWNSSGVTAAVLGSLKGKINPEAHDLGIYILGGKGKYSYYAPNQIKRVSDKHGLKGDELVQALHVTGQAGQELPLGGPVEVGHRQGDHSPKEAGADVAHRPLS